MVLLSACADTALTPPAATIRNPISAASLNLGLNSAPTYSVLGGDVIGLSVSNFQASAVGAFVPGKLRITPRGQGCSAVSSADERHVSRG